MKSRVKRGEPARRGPGRPPIDPGGTEELRIRVARVHRDELQQLARDLHGLGAAGGPYVTRDGVPIEASAARWLIDQSAKRRHGTPSGPAG